MQPHLELLMKDLISYLLDINIPMQSNAFKKRLFNFTILAIDYYWPIQSLTQTKSIFLWLDGLSLFVSPPTNLNCIKSESHSDNCNMGKEGNEVFWIEEMPPTNPNCTKSKTYDDIYCKNHRNINNRVGI